MAAGLGAVMLFSAPLRAELLIDINDRENDTAANTQTGFSAFVIDSVGGVIPIQTGEISRTFGTITVTIRSSSPGTLGYDDRKRAVPANTASFTQAALLQDFIFSRDNTGNGGFDVEISGLQANASYPVTIWSYDNGSGGTRVGDWSAGGIVVKEDYTFDGRTLPADDMSYQFSFNTTSDAAGKILIQGRRDSTSVDANGAASFGVFLNALRVGDSISDSDHDGMNDTWESAHGLNTTLNDSALDPDNDGSTNIQEFTAASDPQDADTDDDGLLDGKETGTHNWTSPNDTGTSPLVADSDGDGLRDSLENPDLPYTGPTQPGTNPNVASTDGDLFSDGEEVIAGTNPTDPLSFPKPGAGAALAVDFDSTGIITQPSFESLDPSTGWTKTYGNIAVTVTAVGAGVTVDHRDRAAANGGGGFNSLWRDFIFANGSDLVDEGLDVEITGLAPDTVYPVTLWAYDNVSGGPHSSTWAANDGGGSFVEKVAVYTFDGALPPPTGLSQNRMDFLITTDAAGRIVIQGRMPVGAAAATHHVFLNGLLFSPASPRLEFTAVAHNDAAGSTTLTWRSVPGAPYAVDFSPDLVQWTEITATLTGAAGATTTYTDTTVPAGTKRRFYQVRRTGP